ACERTAVASYAATRATPLMQAFLPNTFAPGAVNPCPACPSGYVYVTSNASSLRNAAQFTLRRRLHAGLTATAQYAIAKATDAAATFANKVPAVGALPLAQDWRNPGAEEGPSPFDQRHLFTAQLQYTTGMGLTGGTLVDGIRGRLFKNWTIASQLSAGSGLPFTPVAFIAVPGSGVVGIRPSLTGSPERSTGSDSFANT